MQSWLTEIGVRHKPDLCKSCPYAAKGKGFCGDYTPYSPLVAFIFDVPTKDDILEQTPLSGGSGWAWKKMLLEELGHTMEDVLVSYALRCAPPNGPFGRPDYPTAWLGKQAELRCRQYDDKLIEFNPNVFLITLHPRTVSTVGCHRVQIQRDVSKAFEFARRGYRPCVLFGEAPAELYFPAMVNNGGIKNWRGHWWTGSSPFKDSDITESKLNKKRFVLG